MLTEQAIPKYLPKDKLFNPELVPFGKNEVTLTSGYFDLLHYGHIQFLRRCKEIGNPLVVGVLAEKISMKPGRPIINDQERMTLISELASVDYVFLDYEGYSETLLRLLVPKTIIFSSGEESSLEKKRQITFIENIFPNLKIAYIPRQSYKISTTQIIERIKNSSNIGIQKERIQIETIKSDLTEYAQLSNAETKTAAFIVNDEATLLSKGVNYHPDFTGTVIFSNTTTVEGQQLKPRPTHAEMDAVLKLLDCGVTSFKNLILYSLVIPCAGCAEIISRLGFKKVVYYNDFDNNYGELILNSNGIELEKG